MGVIDVKDRVKELSLSVILLSPAFYEVILTLNCILYLTVIKQ